MSDPLDDPAALWPALPAPTAEAGPEPRRWVWEAMDPPERRQRLRELAQWVDWLRRTFELHNQIPSCWYRHPPVVEHLTALYTGWVRTYAGEEAPGRELAEADWINTLHAFTPRLQLAACATGAHEPLPVPPPPPGAQEDFETYLVTSGATTAPARHPAEAEATRAALETDPPL
ncbi:hypothetical protein [Streptomyces sp. NPDC093109]|uniref:hypothetical protein n=1 Tax=Streptomyces sp. NPDC093109 TaxID=3154977 RepID=UPI00344E3A5B